MPAGLDSEIQYLKGVGPRRARLFRRLGIETVEGLLYYFPRQYQDRSRFIPIDRLQADIWATIRARVIISSLVRTRRARTLFRLIVEDETGRITLTWFNQPYLKDIFHAGDEFVFSGKVQRYGSLQMANPEYEKVNETGTDLVHAGRIVPVYPLTEGLPQKTIRSIIRRALDEFLPGMTDMFSPELRSRWQVVSLSRALEDIHFPSSRAALQEARKRLILDEFFLLQLALVIKKDRMTRQPTALPHAAESHLLGRFISSLPFSLTRAQRKVLGEIKRDLSRSFPMNRLLQGDVGSGKTVVAVAALLLTVGNGYQGAVMVPSEILAFQHYQNLTEMLAPFGVDVILLTGAGQGKKKKEKLRRIREGKGQIVIGTQALIQEKVSFSRLGLVVVDEQHKFGVLERSRLRGKGSRPHLLVMTATPIPRTLTLTVYGDLDVSLLDELPPGRKKIKTYWISSESLPEAYAFIRREVDRGRQAYIVYPLIEESETIVARAAREMFIHLKERIFPEYRLGLIHGKVPPAEKERIMTDFRNRSIRILVSTVVIEIGIDIPNATIMLVENAERFGLAQLHQLRGRVGRGGEQSYCILQGNPHTPSARRRLQAMKNIDDGFLIAQEDLEIRGPGEFFGTRQHGLPELRIGRIMADVKLMEFARRQAFEFLQKDRDLSLPEDALIRQRLRARYQGKFDLLEGG